MKTGFQLAAIVRGRTFAASFARGNRPLRDPDSARSLIGRTHGAVAGAQGAQAEEAFLSKLHPTPEIR